MRSIVLAFALAAVSPIGAQVADTSAIRRTAAGWVIDYQQQDLTVILNGLAEAGGLNLTTANIPARRANLRIGQGLTREGVIEVLRAFASAQGLRVEESPNGNLLSVLGTPPVAPPTAAQLAAQAQQAQQVRLYTYRLKHASAVQLAPVLTTLFSGLVARPQGTTIQSGPGGLQIFTPGNTGVSAAVGGPPADVSIGVELPAGGGNVGGGRGGRGGGAALGAQVAERIAAVTQALQGAQRNVSLSSQASEIRIVAEESSNSLLVRATEQDYGLIQHILSTVDLRPLQVLIEVTIAEVTRSNDLNVGISASATRTPDGKTSPDVTAKIPSTASARDFVLQLSGGKGTIDFNVAINALATRGDLKVLSLPVIIAQNNRQAVLNVGSRRPFVQVTQAGGIDPSQRVETIQYLDVGTVLTITPTINPDGYVNLQVSQTANSATNEIQFDAPVISTREATTQVFVRDGQTTVIGGLADNSNRVQRSGVPILSRIPLIGWLFRGTERNQSTSELFLFLTPHVVSSDEDIDRLREQIRDGSELLRDVPIGSRIAPPPADTLAIPPRIIRPPADTTRRPPVEIVLGAGATAILAARSVTG